MAEFQIEDWWKRNELKILRLVCVFLFSSNQTLKSENKRITKYANEITTEYTTHLKQESLAGYKIAARQLQGDSISNNNRSNDSSHIPTLRKDSTRGGQTH